MAELKNCVSCGRLYVKSIRELCEPCYQVLEKKFLTVHQFVRKQENRKAAIDETSEATGVSREDILYFIDQGWLELSSLPNFYPPCNSCGKSTRDGRICHSCRGRFISELNEIIKFSEQGERGNGYYNKNFH